MPNSTLHGSFEPVSGAEEYLWIHHFQMPGGIRYRQQLWRCQEGVDVPMMLEALQALEEAYPILAGAYHLSDDLVLSRRYRLTPPEIRAFDSLNTMNTWFRNQPFQTLTPADQNESVFKAFLLESSDSQTLYLGLQLADTIGHDRHIADIAHWLESCIACLEPLCPWLNHLPAPITSPERSLPLNQWLVRVDAGDIDSSLDIDLSSRETESSLSPPHNSFSQCCQISIDHSDQMGLTALFTRFALVISPSSSLQVQLVTPEKTRLYRLSDDMSADRIETLLSSVSPEDATATNDMASDVPFMRIYLEPRTSEVMAPSLSSRVLLGGAHAMEGVELTISSHGACSHALTLATGQHLSDHAGHILLTHFIAGMKNQGKWQQLAARPLRDMESEGASVVASPSIETRILDEFRVALNAPDMRAEDDFFDYGGDSLLATRIVGSLLDEHDITVQFQDFFAYPNAAALAENAVLDHKPDHTGHSESVSGTEHASIKNRILGEFRTALNAPDMSAEDDFFDHGGDSLLATRIVGSLLDEHGIRIQFQDFFAYPTAAALAENAFKEHEPDIAERSPEVSTTTQEVDEAPLSAAQAGIWRPYAAHGFTTMFNLTFAVRFNQRIDEAVLKQAFQDVLERHAALRTLFIPVSDSAVQRPVPPCQLGRYQWFWTSQESGSLTPDEAGEYCFDLSRELPLRIRCIATSDTAPQTLSLLFHHLVIDEWSLGIVLDDLKKAFLARSERQKPEWATSPRSFFQYSIKEHQAGLNPEHIQYWREMLDGVSCELDLFNQLSGKTAGALPSLEAHWQTRSMPHDLCQSLKQLARAQQTSFFNVMYSAILITLHKLSNASDLSIGTSTAGRTDSNHHDTVGMFTTLVAHRYTLTGDLTLADVITRVRDTINASLPRSDIPIDVVQKALGKGPEDRLPFEAYIQMHKKNVLSGTLVSADGTPYHYNHEESERTDSLFRLHFEILEEETEIRSGTHIELGYRIERYSDAQANIILNGVAQVAHLMVQPGAINKRLEDLPGTVDHHNHSRALVADTETF